MGQTNSERAACITSRRHVFMLYYITGSTITRNDRASATRHNAPLRPFLSLTEPSGSGNLNSFLRMRRVFRFVAKFRLALCRQQVPEPFSTKMSRSPCPVPAGGDCRWSAVLLCTSFYVNTAILRSPAKGLTVWQHTQPWCAFS